MVIRKLYIIIISSVIAAAVLIFGGIAYYQSTRFDANVAINGIKVGGMTPEKALKKLKTFTFENKVYVGNKLIYDGKDTSANFSNKDLPAVRKLLSKQAVLWPSFKEKNDVLMPGKTDHYRSRTMREEVASKLKSMNKDLKAPTDAQAHLEDGEITVSKSKKGEQYDISKLLKEYDKQVYNSKVYLKALRSQPVAADSNIVKNEKKKLEELVKHTVDYKVQNKTYSLKASEFIQHATINKNMEYSIDTDQLKSKIDSINRSQSTLNKNYIFKTHSGSVISAKGQSYGWALDAGKETERIKSAFEKGENLLKAYNVYGVGYSTYGIGYHVTTNHGIGNTYAEVSIKEQRIWIYVNGKLKVTTRVVTGRHDTHEDTPKGVWYIMYKESPSVLEGSETGSPHYKIKVSYWAPFTNSGCGFHDAGWRKNWASDAYLKNGSGGCVNTPSAVMKTVYGNLTQNEPVVIY